MDMTDTRFAVRKYNSGDRLTERYLGPELGDPAYSIEDARLFGSVTAAINYIVEWARSFTNLSDTFDLVVVEVTTSEQRRMVRVLG